MSRQLEGLSMVLTRFPIHVREAVATPTCEAFLEGLNHG
jgi:hypothetical protein